MKTPFPHHPEPRTYAWTKLEKETIRSAMVAAWNEAIEDAVNAYSPDDTATDFMNKIIDLKEQA